MSATSSSELVKWMSRCLRGEESPHIAHSVEKRPQVIIETVQVEQYARRVQLCKGYEGNDLRYLLQCPRVPRHGTGHRVDSAFSLVKRRARRGYCARTISW